MGTTNQESTSTHSLRRTGTSGQPILKGIIIELPGHEFITATMVEKSGIQEMSFAYPDADYPSVIILISNSTKAEEMAQRANDYICTSDREANIVIVFMTVTGGDKWEAAKEDKTATFTIWKRERLLQDGKETICAVRTEHEIFRNKDGSPNMDAKITFLLRDFAPQALVDRYPRLGNSVRDIPFPAQLLCGILKEAELNPRGIMISLDLWRMLHRL
ncbi:hypothetical protein A1O3_06144 [Capronia epimyces CBS 606.96]|uniref:Uncharacterized protein n=1 Tax=Capronia epimyces CBS 606.96 TaxID=1182542 RepID=W9XZE9_9EURO|nr:uncharacterized protein A1O3_06144 [Capronia epimyces CBS 606.96]EXJ82331.1 hypothetical protein A1O3_06144 [Capronia epimyces CBS 606.96]